MMNGIILKQNFKTGKQIQNNNDMAAISQNASWCLLLMDGIELKQYFKIGKQTQNNSNDIYFLINCLNIPHTW